MDSKARPQHKFSSCIAGEISAVLLFLFTNTPAFSQQNAVLNPARITQAVDDSVLTTLKGNVHPLAKPQYDKGPANPSLPADRMQLVLQRSPGQEIVLHQLLGSLQDPNSTQYRKWLTPDQFGGQYGVSDADIQTVWTWLVSQGFTVNKVNKAHTIIEFSGTIGQLQTAFHTEIHNFTVNGEEHLANISDPEIPTALTPAVAGLSSLNNFFPEPPHTKPQGARYDEANGKFEPDLTSRSGDFLYVGAGDAATIYDTPNAWNANFRGGVAFTGANVVIGIIAAYDIVLTDIANYRAFFGLPPAVPSIVVDGNDPGSAPSGYVEPLLDLEVSGGLAPGASQILYLAASTSLDPYYFLAINRAIDDNVVSIISVSVEQCELYLGSTGNKHIYSLSEQAAAQGISMVVSSSDSGSAGCDNFHITPAQADFGLQVNGLSSTPFNISVGGSDFDVLATNFSQYVSMTHDKHYTSAKGYIPEEPWNDSTNVNALLSTNTPVLDTTGDTNIRAGSGGRSGCVNPSIPSNVNFPCLPIAGAKPGWPKPSWQTGGNLNIQPDGVRDLPDISLLAGGGFYHAGWLICDDDPASDGHTTNCANDNGSFYFEARGGTSVSAPAFAGILALIGQSQGGARLGQADYVLYNLANQTSLYSSIFHDITQGNNSVYCLPGSPDCGSNLFETGYNAGTAYDLASGLGSVDVTQLVDNWNKAAFTPTTTTLTINGGTAPVSITHGQAVTLNASVSSAGGTPIGDVELISNANQQANTYGANDLGVFTLSSGTTGPVAYSDLPGGTYSVFANYEGDITFTQSQSSPAIQITVAQASTTNMVASSASSVSSGTFTVTSLISPTPASSATPPTGTVTLNANGGTIGTGTVSSAFDPNTGASLATVTITVNASSLAIGANNITSTYSGDANYSSSTGTVMVTSTATTRLTITGTSITAITAGNSGTSTVTLTPGTGFTGMVALTCSITVPSGATSVPTCSLNPTSVPISVATAGTSTLTVATIPTTTPGKYMVTIDAMVSGGVASPPSTLTVTVNAGFVLSGTAATVSSPGMSGTSTITITPTNYTGTVRLGCVLVTQPSGANGTDNPSCSVLPSTASITGSSAVTATATFTTTAAASTALAYPQIDQSNRWYTAAGGAALTCIFFFGIPKRRRGWRSMLCLLVFLVALAGVGCDGDGGYKPSSNSPGVPGTTTGTYTFAVTGTDAVTNTVTASTVVTVIVD